MGAFGAVNFADWLVSVFAGPAIGFADLLIVPARYMGVGATKRESFAIAGLWFGLSTDFWIAFGDLVSVLARLFRRRATKRPTKAT